MAGLHRPPPNSDPTNFRRIRYLMPIMKVPLLGHIELYAFKSTQQIALNPRHNPLKPIGHFMYIQFTHIESSTSAHRVYFCSPRISTQAAIISPHNDHSLVSIKNKECGNKMPTRSNRAFYCRSYCLLNMFRAPLFPSSGAQEYYALVGACGISCCGFQVANLVWS